MKHSTPVYVYIAANQSAGASFVGITPTLLDMAWIAKYGVDNLVWFEAFDTSAAEVRAKELRSLSEAQRESVFLRHNPDRSDLTPRIWASDPED